MVGALAFAGHVVRWWDERGHGQSRDFARDFTRWTKIARAACGASPFECEWSRFDGNC
jgi:hypothetical protein